ncbi:ABC transporter permease [Methylobacterium variabile]|uniref:ABC transporter permease n=1 Tax=Methylobacterium variabile TaxID=298794 RepID=A0A0J6SFF8_9HYPH|nr:ABC transporter substrate-binding protein [Methylobacterium variabile]KMO32078.1 ABC transporter permease [Methylobacterium variabile]
MRIFTGGQVLASLILALGLASTPARAEISGGVVRIGVLNDASGMFRDVTGEGSVVAARMAAEDFAGGGKGIKVEIVRADHQNKPDVGSALVRRWIDVDGVDAVVDVPNSAVGLAVNAIARGTRLTFLASSTASSDLTGKFCSPNTIQWVNDTWATAHALTSTMLKRGAASWYFLTVHFALGQAIEADAARFLKAAGARVLGSAQHPMATADFSALLLRAQSSGAKVVALANSGADTITAVKQAAEFGISENQDLVAFLAFINDIDAIGLPVAKNLLLTESFYWDLTDETRAFAKRFADRMGGTYPSANQAGVYSATRAYLEAVAETGADEAATVIPAMKARGRFKDPLFQEIEVRADGRAIHPLYLFQVKAPSESKGRWDYYKLLQTVPTAEAFRPLAEGGCPLVR